MEKTNLDRKKLIIKIMLLLVSTVFLSLLWHFQIAANNSANTQKKDETKVKTVKSSINSKITVYSLNKIPFPNGENIVYKLSTLDQLEKSKNKDIILIPKDYLKDMYKEKIKKLVKSGDTVIFFGDDISAEKVVFFFNREIPVVPIQSTVPLKFQAYGITTLNKELIPVFVSATLDQNELNSNSFTELFKQISQKNN
ncbi:hypothetical protein AAGG74_14480 [Bacillus mexicanus]|uniref:hypothetical protein n=1 Tax=Bacillus mexicanus TaxID=2834415 RepID=UPI003D19A98C